MATNPPSTTSVVSELTADNDWYRTSVFYEVVVRAFHDSTASGSGDFQGLTEKLDYLQWLGIDVIWVTPFYASPLRDGGYDISDYKAVLPEYGTMDDVRTFISQAHQRGIRVITDLAINHTSDAHPWFQASRSDPDGPYGDYYMWSDNNQKYPDARIIFIDFETSNWTLDPVRKQYFWHRFFSHQPDLNYENPKVQEEILDILRYWMTIGVDGIRLDALPYLYAAEGTNCENLEATHEFTRKVRAMVDAEFPGRILLAESNQPPKETVAYFGTAAAPECHMAFHFPVMPQIYRALRTETASPIVDALSDTPDIPPGAQWGTFLRNHDELSLEMVTDEQRQDIYGWYATDPRMRSNVGIRRRLSTLLENSRAQLELANILLLSLPGSPYLYYGDEIGMGDNIWLNDRDAVRTPMQWSPDRNAGFSAADPGQLYLPVVQSLVWHYQHVNVEAQQASSSSLLHWMRRVLALRKAHPVFGLGNFAVAPCDNEHILAFVRENADAAGETEPETILCVNNLSDSPQGTTITVRDYPNADLEDLFGGQGFPRTTDTGEVSVTLGARGYLWLRLVRKHGQ